MSEEEIVLRMKVLADLAGADATIAKNKQAEAAMLRVADANLRVKEAQARYTAALTANGAESLKTERATVALAKAQQSAATAEQKMAEQLRAVSTETVKTADASTRAKQQLDALKSAAFSAGGGFVAMGMAGAAAAMKISADFKAGLNIIRIGTGATGDSLKALGTDFKAAFAGGSQPAKEVAQVVADLNTRLGLTGEPLQKLTQQFGQLSQMGVGASVENVTRVFGDWGVATDKQSAAMDTLFKASQATGPSIDRLSGLVVQFGAPMRQLGFSFEESLAMLGKWEKEGVNTELVMGSMKKAIAHFASEGVPLREGLNDTVEKLKAAKDSSEAFAIAAGVVGTRAAGDFAAAAREGKFDIASLVKSIGESPETIGKAAAATETMGQKIQRLKNQAMVAAAPIGDMLKGLMGSAFSKASDAVHFLVDGFGKLPAPVKEAGAVLLITVGVAATLAAGLPLVGAAAALAATGFTALTTTVMAAAAALGPFLLPVMAVVAAIALLKHGHDDLAKGMQSAYEQTQKTGGGFDAYVAATQRAKDQTTGLGKVWAALGTNEGLDLQSSTQAWMQYGLGVDAAVMKTDAFKAAQQAAGAEWRRTGDVEAYKTAMLAAADAASMAAGKGHVLSEAQREVSKSFSDTILAADAHKAGISDATIKSDKYQEAVKRTSEAVAQHTIDADKAKAQLLALGQSMDTVSEAAAKQARDTAQATGAMATYTSGFAAMFAAGSKWTDDQEEMAKLRADSDKQAESSMRGTLEKLWQSQKSYGDRLKAAQKADADAAAAARAQAAKNAQAHNDKMADLEAKHAEKVAAAQAKMGSAKTAAQVASAQKALDAANKSFAEAESKEAQHWNTVVGQAKAGGGQREKEVRETYMKEVADAKEALAQTIVEWTKGQVLTGAISQKTAESIFGNLSKAFPGVEVVRPFDVATVGLMSDLGKMADGADHNASFIVDKLNEVPDAMQRVADDSRKMTDTMLANSASTAASTAARSSSIHASLAAERTDHALAAEQATKSSIIHANAQASAATASANRSKGVLASLAPEKAAQIDMSKTATTESAKTAAAHGLVGSSAKAAGGQVASAASGIKSSLTGIPSAASRAAGELKTASSGMGSAVRGAAGQLDGAKTQMTGALSGIASAHATTWTKVRSEVGTVGPHTQSKLAETNRAIDTSAATAKTNATKMGHGIATGVGGGLDDSRKKFDSWASGLQTFDMGKVGKAIVDGLWTGLQGAWRAMLADFDALVQLLPEAVKHILGIASPSKVFQSLGTAIMLGLALGISAGGKSAEAAMSEAVSKVNVQAKMALAQMGQDLVDFYAKHTGPGSVVDKIREMWTSLTDNDLNTMPTGAIPASMMPKEPDWRLFAGDPDKAKAAWDAYWDEMAKTEEARNRNTVGERLPAGSEHRYTPGSLTEMEHRFASNPDKMEMVDRMKKIEQNRHNLVMALIAAEKTASEDAWKKLQEAQAKYQEDLQKAQAAVQAAQAAAEKREDLVSDAIKERIADQAAAWEKAHNEVMAGLTAEKDAEDRRHADAIKALADERGKWESYLAAQEAGVKKLQDVGAELNAQMGRLKIDLDLDTQGKKLEELKNTMSSMKSIADSLVLFDPKKAQEAAAKAAHEKIALTTEAQRAALRGAVGSLSGDALRTAQLLLGGYAISAQKVRDLFAGIMDHAQANVDAQQKLVDAGQAEIDALQKKIDLNKQLVDEANIALNKEKERVGVILAGIADREKAENDRNTAELGRIAGLVAAENAAYDKLKEQVAEMQRAEEERHTDRMRQIAEEYAYKLLALDHTEEEIAALSAAAAAEAKKIGEDAARLFAGILSGSTAANAGVATLVKTMGDLRRAIQVPIVPGNGGGSGGDDGGVIERPGNAARRSWKKAAEEVEHYIDLVIQVGKIGRDQEREILRKENQTTRQGRGGFRAGHDWEQWHNPPSPVTPGGAVGGLVGGGLPGIGGPAMPTGSQGSQQATLNATINLESPVLLDTEQIGTAMQRTIVKRGLNITLAPNGG